MVAYVRTADGWRHRVEVAHADYLGQLVCMDDGRWAVVVWIGELD